MTGFYFPHAWQCIFFWENTVCSLSMYLQKVSPKWWVLCVLNESEICSSTLALCSPLLLLTLEAAGREGAELHAGLARRLWQPQILHAVVSCVSQHFLISSYKFCSCLCQICLYSNKFLARLISVTPRHIFYSLPSLLLARARKSALTLLGFQKFLLLFKNTVSEFRIDHDPSVSVFNYRNGSWMKAGVKDPKSLPQSLEYFQESHIC